MTCKYCGNRTDTEDKVCHDCWELEHRMRFNIELAQKIMDAVKAEAK